MSLNGKFIILQFLTFHPQSTALNIQSWMLHHPTSNLCYFTSIIHHHLFFLHPYSKPQTFVLNICSENICPGNICSGNFCPGNICQCSICPVDHCNAISQQLLSWCGLHFKGIIINRWQLPGNIDPGNKSPGDNCNPSGISLYSSNHITEGPKTSDHNSRTWLHE